MDPVLVAGGRVATHTGRPIHVPGTIGLAVQIPCRTPHHFPKFRYWVTNWAEYDASLKRRGSLTVWFYRRSRPDVAGGAANHARRPAALLGPGDQHGLDDGLGVWPGAAADRGDLMSVSGPEELGKGSNTNRPGFRLSPDSQDAESTIPSARRCNPSHARKGSHISARQSSSREGKTGRSSLGQRSQT
jgi:hypothetical protein